MFDSVKRSDFYIHVSPIQVFLDLRKPVPIAFLKVEKLFFVIFCSKLYFWQNRDLYQTQ